MQSRKNIVYVLHLLIYSLVDLVLNKMNIYLRTVCFLKKSLGYSDSIIPYCYPVYDYTCKL